MWDQHLVFPALARPAPLLVMLFAAGSGVGSDAALGKLEWTVPGTPPGGGGAGSRGGEPSEILDAPLCHAEWFAFEPCAAADQDALASKRSRYVCRSPP